MLELWKTIVHLHDRLLFPTSECANFILTIQHFPAEGDQEKVLVCGTNAIIPASVHSPCII